MATLATVCRYRYTVLVWGLLECLLFTAIIYGWASLVFALKEESFFQDMCSSAPTPANTTRVDDHCNAQDDLLNLAFTIGVFTFTSFGVIAGILLDHCGPRVTRLLACFTFGVTGIIFVFTDKDRPMLIYPGVIGLTLSGILLFITLIQIAVLFRRWHTLVASLFNGALDSSSIVLLFFKLIHDAGVPLQWIFSVYFILAVASSLAFTFMLPVESMRANKVDEFLVEQESDSALIEEISEEEDEDDDEVEDLKVLKQLFERTDPARGAIGIKRGSCREFWKIAVSPMYLLLVLYLSVHKLRLWFFMGSMDIFLRFATSNHLDTVNTYLNVFGVIQFTGMLFSPIVGLIMTWRPENKENKTFGFIIAICLTNSLNIFLNVIVVVPVIELQMLSFIVQVVLRAFVYSTYSAFILHRFPHEHYGKLYGVGHFIGAVFGALQFYLFVIVQTRLEGDPFWVNVAFLIFTLILFVFPFYVWVVTEKETDSNIHS